MKNPMTVLFTAVLAAAMTAPALAEKGERGSRMLDRFDTDGDGRISMSEFQPPRAGAMLERADTNEDGMVTLEEAEQHHQEMMAERLEQMKQRMDTMQARMRDHFTEMDANGDGAVTKDEARQSAFSRIDKDSDGFLTPEEFKDARKGMREDRPEMHKRHYPGKRPD